jgi:hypothetical protein
VRHFIITMIAGAMLIVIGCETAAYVAAGEASLVARTRMPIPRAT